jgi:tRNA(Ile)-lysidine synthase
MIARAVGEARRALCAGDGGGAGWLRGERVLIACSGGPDSLALLGVMELLAPSLEVTLAVGHVDHGLRVSSALEAAQVEALAARRGLPFAGARLELAVGAGLPARARRARRAALEALAAGCGAGWIALGHTATDQAETVLMHMVRGAGLEGLAGMAAIEGRWLRPLLRITRAEAAALCGRLGLGLAAIDDPTNHDERHLRVELREAVLPRLRARNPRLERAISALTGQARDAEDALAGWAAREEAGRRGAAGWSLVGFEGLPRAIRWRVLRRIIARGAGATAGSPGDGGDDGDDEAGLRVDAAAELGSASVEAIDRAIMARAAAIGGTEAALAPRQWSLAGGIRLELGPMGLRVRPQRGGGRANH